MLGALIIVLQVQLLNEELLKAQLEVVQLKGRVVASKTTLLSIQGNEMQSMQTQMKSMAEEIRERTISEDQAREAGERLEKQVETMNEELMDSQMEVMTAKRAAEDAVKEAKKGGKTETFAAKGGGWRDKFNNNSEVSMLETELERVDRLLTREQAQLSTMTDAKEQVNHQMHIEHRGV